MKAKNTECFEIHVLLHYLLNDYATLLEYLISSYPKIEHPIFDANHFILFQNRLGLANMIIDRLDSGV